LEPTLYRALVAAWPPLELFHDTGKHGRKLALSAKNNGAKFQRFVRATPVWREFFGYLRSDEFIFGTFDMLRQHNIDLGISAKSHSFGRRLAICLAHLAQGCLPATPPALSSRLEFSALSADGGELLPHTDTQKKIVTFVVSMLGEDEWNPAYGGGTEVLKTRDARLNYNDLNRQLPWEQVETLKTFEYRPNQALVFVKTFNSLHGVRRMTGNDSKVWRRTLTLNIVSTP
jgi:hypothetical protein